MSRRPVIVLSLLICLLASPATALLTPLGAAGGATVGAATATPHFPDKIAFHLEATATTGEITKAKLLFRPVGAPTARAAFPPVERGQRVALDYTQDMTLTSTWLPPGLDVEYWWVLTLSAGGTFTSAPQTFFYMDPAFQWKKMTSGPVTFYWYSGDDAFAKAAVDSATKTYDNLRKQFGIESAPPIRLVSYANTRDFRNISSPQSQGWEGGFNLPVYRVIILTLRPGASPNPDIGQFVPHEVTHQITYEASRNPYAGLPGWLDEGFAVHNQDVPNLSFRPRLKDAVDKGQLIPLRALNQPFNLTPNTDAALLGYAEGESVVNYIITAYGSKTLGALITAFHGDLTPDQAVQKVFKESLDDLDKEWRASLNYAGDQGGITG